MLSLKSYQPFTMTQPWEKASFSVSVYAFALCSAVQEEMVALATLFE